MKRQHGNHIQLPVARKILRIDDFIVSDRRANVLPRKPLAQRLDAIQTFVHRPIPVGVHVRVETGTRDCHEDLAQYGSREIHLRSAVRARHPLPVRRSALGHEIGFEHRAGERRRRDHAVEK